MIYREVLADRHPPECVTRNQEVLFVDAQDREVLREWAQQQKVPQSEPARHLGLDQ